MWPVSNTTCGMSHPYPSISYVSNVSNPQMTVWGALVLRLLLQTNPQHGSGALTFPFPPLPPSPWRIIPQVARSCGHLGAILSDKRLYPSAWHLPARSARRYPHTRTEPSILLCTRQNPQYIFMQTQIKRFSSRTRQPLKGRRKVLRVRFRSMYGITCIVRETRTTLGLTRRQFPLVF